MAGGYGPPRVEPKPSLGVPTVGTSPAAHGLLVRGRLRSTPLIRLQIGSPGYRSGPPGRAERGQDGMTRAGEREVREKGRERDWKTLTGLRAKDRAKE